MTDDGAHKGVVLVKVDGPNEDTGHSALEDILKLLSDSSRVLISVVISCQLLIRTEGV